MNKKVNFLKKIDSIIGPPTVYIVKTLLRPRNKIPDRIRSILFIRPGGIGDAVLLLPSIIALKESYPHATVTVLCEKRNSEIFSLSREVDKVLLYDQGVDLLSALKGRYDLVIDTEQWYRLSAIIAYLTRAPIRIGFATNERKLLFSRSVSYSQDKYEKESFFDLPGDLLQSNVAEDFPFLFLQDREHKKAASILGPLSDKKIVVLFPGGSIPEKKWPIEKFHSLADSLTRQGYGLVIVGGQDDYAACCQIAEGIEGIINTCGNLTLAESAAIVNRASLLISGDSGILHMAYAMHIPTLSLFGPGNEKKWAPKGALHEFISKGLDCSPCSRFGNTPECLRNRECMDLIEVEEVLNKAMEMLVR